MTKLDITRPEIILLLTKAYEKEKALRSYWVSKRTALIQLAATLTREPTNYCEEDVTKHTIIEGMATITRDHQVAARNRRKIPIRDVKSIPGIERLRYEYSIISLGVSNAKEDPRLARPDTDLSPDLVMRPVDSKTKKVFLKPKPHNGREKYLNERAKIIPEKKYYLPECVSWDHGWRMCDSKKPGEAMYGRHWTLQKTLKNVVGPAWDLDHYKTPTSNSYKKC